MIISRTPFRVSFVGGGSDIGEFYKHSQGAVLSTTINKYMYIYTHDFFDEDKIRLKYSQNETVTDVNDIKHPIIRDILKKFRITGAIEISSNADIPSNTGLGSSSSFTVGLLHNLYTKFGKYASKDLLAREACDVEINQLKEPIGKQDQYASAFGGLNVILFDPSGTVRVNPVHLTKSSHEALQKNLITFYTGIQRKASSILDQQGENMKLADKREVIKKMVELVWELRDALQSSDLNKFGEILHKNWLLKKRLTDKISNSMIDDYYETALKHGASGGKILGAGGGGFLLLYCEEKNHARLKQAMSSLKEMKFSFDNEGSKILHIGDEQNYNY